MNVTITQTVRPVKLAIFVIPGSKKSYLKAVQICSCFWGGACFPILPFYKTLSRKFRYEYRVDDKTADFYFNTLANFDPDIIIVDDSVDPAEVSTFVDGRSVFTMSQVEQSFDSQEEGFGVGVEVILRTLKEQEFKYHRTDGLQVYLPAPGSSNLLEATLLGAYAPVFHQRLMGVGLPENSCVKVKRLEGESEGYYDPNVLTALDVTLQGLENVGDKGWSSDTGIFLLNPNRVEDLLLFWNLRAMGWNMLAVPILEYKEEIWLKRIQRQQQLFHSHFNLLNSIHILTGCTIARETTEEVRQFLSAVQINSDKIISYSHHWWIPRFWHTLKNMHYDRAWANTPWGAQKDVVFEWNTHSALQVSVLKPKFDINSYHSKRLCYVNDVQFTVDGMQPQYAQVLPEMPSEKVERLTRWGYKKWRFSPKGYAFLAAGWDKNFDIVIPLSERVFSEWFTHHNLSIRHSAAGKLAKQLLMNIGHMYGVNMFANPGLLPILTLFEGGKIVNKKTLFTEAGRQLLQHNDNFRVKEIKDIVNGLIEKNIIQAGFQVQCSFCNQHSFYTLRELDERLRCGVCQNTFVAPVHTPDDIKWSYRGLGPFSRNNRAEGMIAVLLTLRFFRITLRHDALLSSTLSFDILENNLVVNEVDLALFYKEFKHSSQGTDLFFCECKTEIDFGLKDIERMKRLGDRFPGAVLVFATLKTRLSNNEKVSIGKMVKYFRGGLKSRPKNPVLILTGNELLNRMFGLSHFQDEMHRYNHNHDTIGRLCDLTCREYLDIPTHESEVSARIDVIHKKRQHAQNLKHVVLTSLLQSLANRTV